MTLARRTFLPPVAVAAWAWSALAVLAGGAGQVPAAPAQAPGPRTDPHMTWWRQSRVGMLVHWGLFSVPAGAWQGKPVPGPAERIMQQARISPGDYRALAGQFNPAGFEPAKWARIAQQAGIRYVGVTAKHHEGYCLWKTALGEFSVAQGSWGRDVVAELGKACREQKLGFGVYFSLADWCRPAGAQPGPEHRARLMGQIRELTTDYSDVLLVWLDAAEDSPAARETAAELGKLVRRRKPLAILSGATGLPGQVGDVRGASGEMPAPGGGDWEFRLPVAGSAGYKAPALDCKPAKELVRTLVEVVSRGGNLLLEVPATAEGKIPLTVAGRLLGMGRWLRVNGRSIYGAGGSTLGRPGWGCCTHRPGEIYLHVLDWPRHGLLDVPSPRGRVAAAYLLADEKKSPLRFLREGPTVRVHLPARAPDDPATVVVLKIDGDVTMSPEALAWRSRPIALNARVAKTHGGGKLVYENAKDRDNLGLWFSVSDWASWDFTAQTAGEFAVEITYACPQNNAGGQYVLTVAGQELKGTVEATGDWGKFVTKPLGRVRLPRAGAHTLSVKPTKIRPRAALMNLQSVTLRPVG